MLALGFNRVDKNGNSILRFFGMNGANVSFNCDYCGIKVENRLPMRMGGGSRWFCSLPCAWMDRASDRDLDALCRWLSVSEGWHNESGLTTLVRIKLYNHGRVSPLDLKDYIIAKNINVSL